MNGNGDGKRAVKRLEIQNVSLAYPGRNGNGGIPVLREINLGLDDGEFLVVLGPSGCGKTTLLNLIAGFLRPSSGEILLDGEPVAGPGRDRGVVFQKHALLPWLSVAKNAEFGLKLQGVRKEERREIAGRYIDLVGLSDYADHPIYELSGGMQQRLGLARALAADPRMLLMDEPLGALDALTRESMQELILDIWNTTEKLIFFITHSVEEAIFLATRLVVLSDRPGHISRTIEPPFSREYLKSRDARTIKSSPEYIAMREEVLSLVRSGGADNSEAGHGH